jgi:hypothetical protein
LINISKPPPLEVVYKKNNYILVKSMPLSFRLLLMIIFHFLYWQKIEKKSEEFLNHKLYIEKKGGDYYRKINITKSM